MIQSLFFCFALYVITLARADDDLGSDYEQWIDADLRGRSCFKLCSRVSIQGQTEYHKLVCKRKAGVIAGRIYGEECGKRPFEEVGTNPANLPCDCTDIGVVSLALYASGNCEAGTEVMEWEDVFIEGNTHVEQFCGFIAGDCESSDDGTVSLKLLEIRGVSTDVCTEESKFEFNAGLFESITTGRLTVKDGKIMAAPIALETNSYDNMMTTVGIPVALLSTAALVYKCWQSKKQGEYKELLDDKPNHV